MDVAAVEGALAKTEPVMPDKLLYQARSLQEAIVFNVAPSPALRHNEYVSTLSSAVHQRQRVFIRYQSWGGDESEREFDPYGILFNEGYWYTSGYCHLRENLRTFRLDRVTALEPREGTFERPADFDVLAHVLSSIAAMPGTDQVEVLLKTTLEHARQIISPVMGTLEDSPEGVIFRRATLQLEWVANVLLTLDFPVTIIHPPALRDMLRDMASRALRIANGEP